MTTETELPQTTTACPRCGETRPLGQYAVCRPCGADQGWDPPCRARLADDDRPSADHAATCGPGRAYAKGQPPASVDPLTQRWYVHPNDLIGGWSVLNRDHPPSHLHHRNDPAGVEVAETATEDVARHIADLHNAHLERPS